MSNRRWTYGNLALLGDAAHTTHFTIGSGTRLAMEDAMVLASSLATHGEIEPALADYARTRRAAIAEAQRAASAARAGMSGCRATSTVTSRTSPG